MMQAAQKINPLRVFLFTVIACLFLLNAGGVHADDLQTCDDDADCFKAYACADVAMNKSHYDEWQKTNHGCDSAAIPRPNARAVCQKHQCVLTDAPAGASLEWFACFENDDCTKIYSCRDMAINKGYVDIYKTAHPDSCLASPRPNPDAFAKCLDGQCTLMNPSVGKLK